MIATGIMALGGLAQTVFGAIQKKKNQDALDELEAPDLDNAFKDIQISTVGSDMMNEQNARGFATVADNLRSGGVRSVMGGTPQLVSGMVDANQQTRNYLDKQVQDREYAIAQQEGRIQRIEENRYQQELQGLGQAIEVGNQQMWSGIRGIAGSVMYGERNGVFDGLFGGGEGESV